MVLLCLLFILDDQVDEEEEQDGTSARLKQGINFKKNNYVTAILKHYRNFSVFTSFQPNTPITKENISVIL